MRTLSLVLFLTGTLFCRAQPVDSLRQIIDSTVSKMQQFSLHRKEIDWVEFRRKVYAQTKDISNLDSLLNQFPHFFKWINDYHGAVATPKKWIKWREGKPGKEINSMLDSALKKGPRLSVERWGDVGYFRVPPVAGLANEIPARTQRLVDSLCKIEPSSIKGWIIDLRLNTGGNVWPMLTSLAFLIGDGTIGGLRYIDGKPDVLAYIKEGKPFGNNQFYSIPSMTCSLSQSSAPVVVLTSGVTSSSGEALLLSFVGRHNTIIMGEQTGGYVTSNINFTLHKDVELFLANAYMMDRTGKFYTEGILPDITIKDGDNFYDLTKDMKIQKALEWLYNKMK